VPTPSETKQARSAPHPEAHAAFDAGENGGYVAAIAAEVSGGAIEIGLSNAKAASGEQTVGLFITAPHLGRLSIGATLQPDGLTRIVSAARSDEKGRAVTALLGMEAALQHRVDGLRQLISETQTQLSSALDRARSLEEKVAQTEKRLANAVSAKADLERSAKASAQASSQAAQKDQIIQKLNADVARLTAEVEKSRSDQAREARQREEAKEALEAVGASKARLEAELKTKQSQGSDLSKELSRLRGEQERSIRKIEELKTALDRAQSAGTEVTSERDAALARVEELAASLDRAQSAFTEIASERDVALARVEELSAELQDALRRQAEISRQLDEERQRQASSLERGLEAALPEQGPVGDAEPVASVDSADDFGSLWSSPEPEPFHFWHTGFHGGK
jgi:chromosome segregation ATPase